MQKMGAKMDEALSYFIKQAEDKMMISYKS